MMQSKWNNVEVKKLFQTVEKYKNENKSLLDAFKEFAKKSNRKPNSVRNYYYAEIARLDKDKKRASKLGIDLGKHQKNEFNFFSEEEKNNIIKAEINIAGPNGIATKPCSFTVFFKPEIIFSSLRRTPEFDLPLSKLTRVVLAWLVKLCTLPSSL